jgi:hypothetical protein
MVALTAEFFAVMDMYRRSPRPGPIFFLLPGTAFRITDRYRPAIFTPDCRESRHSRPYQDHLLIITCQADQYVYAGTV